MSIGFGVEYWFVVGCFIADLSMVVSLLMNISSQVNVFLRGGDSEGWGGGLVGLIGWGGGCIGRRFSRARMRALVLGVLFFLLSQVSQRMELKILHHPKNDASFYRKWRVVLLKTTCHFIENDVSFYRKTRIVLSKTTCRFVESDVLFWIGGRKVRLRMVFWEVFGVE